MNLDSYGGISCPPARIAFGRPRKIGQIIAWERFRAKRTRFPCRSRALVDGAAALRPQSRRSPAQRRAKAHLVGGRNQQDATNSHGEFGAIHAPREAPQPKGG